MNSLFFDVTNNWIIIETYSDTSPKIPVYSFKGFFPRESSFRLVKEIEVALLNSNFQKPDMIVACNGPGSFTGIRICVSTARNFGQIWNTPVVGINSIEFYSEYYFQKSGKPSIVFIEGGQGKFFSGIYDKKGFGGCYDIAKEEIALRFSKLESETLIYSDSKSISDSIDMNTDIPDGRFLIPKIFEDDSLLENFNYKNLHPNYMRGTYAKEKKN